MARPQPQPDAAPRGPNGLEGRPACYAIVVAQPLSLLVVIYGTGPGATGDDDISNVVMIAVDCGPGAIAQSGVLGIRVPGDGGVLPLQERGVHQLQRQFLEGMIVLDQACACPTVLRGAAKPMSLFVARVFTIAGEYLGNAACSRRTAGRSLRSPPRARSKGSSTSSTRTWSR